MPQYTKEIRQERGNDEIKKNGSDLQVRVSGSDFL